MRNMYDGLNSDARAIAESFPHAELVAGYVNGAYAWSQAEWDLFPNATHVGVTVFAVDAGDVLDVENGDATPGQTQGWIAQRKAAGIFRPTIYCNLSTVPAVRQGTGPYVLGRDYDLWVARYDNSTESVYSGSAAKQYATSSSWDASAVYDDAWPHRTAPKPPAPPKPWAPLSVTPSIVVTLDIGRGAVDYTGSYTTVIKDRSGRQVYTQTGTETVLKNVRLPGLGSYLITTAAEGYGTTGKTLEIG
jgi:hypothetical protein